MSRPFFVMCHHKAPHRSWECDEKHKGLYTNKIQLPDTFTDDYKNRAKAASVAKMRVADDFTYNDMGLVQPDGGVKRVGVLMEDGRRKIPNLSTEEEIKALQLIDNDGGRVFTFSSASELAEFKYQ